jgi:hypothetical protein
MANRSYLYSTNMVPKAGARQEGRKFTGISEWNYEIPLVFKILISINTRRCTSLILVDPQEGALIGEYDAGVDRLFRFLKRISTPKVAPLRDKAMQFLGATESKNKYFYLECAELFMMSSEPFSSQIEQLLHDIWNVESNIEEEIKFINSIGHATRDEDLYKIGLGHWSNALYYSMKDK